MPTIFLAERRLAGYESTVGRNVVVMLRRLAEPLAGLRVLHLSAGPFGSAVAEMLAGLVPLQRDLGIEADWHLLRGDAPRIWTALYEALAGTSVRWGSKERAAWHAYAERHAAVITPGYDVVVAHDPQAIAMAGTVPEHGGPRWVWHCHLDTRDAQEDVWADVKEALQPYSAVLYHSPSFVRPDLELPRIGLGRPAIDPCSPRNLPLPSDEAQELLGRLGIDVHRPMIGQVAPIDHRYAPLAALGTYWVARREVSGLQIVLVDGSLAISDRSRRDLEQIADAAGGDPDVHLLTPEAGLRPQDLNALEQAMGVALQLAVPRGFGWGLAECQWKARPAVVGRHGQLPEQVGEGEGGMVVAGASEAAEAVVRLLRDPTLAAALGRRGRERVAREYLITGLLGDYLRLLRQIVLAEPARGQASTG